MNGDINIHETRPRPLAINMTLPTFAAERQRLLSMDMFCPWGVGCSAANPLHAAAAVDRWDKQIDAGPFHRPCYTRGSVSKKYCIGRRAS